MPPANVSITRLATYIPPNSVDASILGTGGRGTCRVAGFDEDAVTMAFEAASRCLDGGTIDRIILASNTLPYRAGPSLSVAAAAAGLPEETPTTAVTGTWRAGLDALRVAHLAAAAGERCLVVASERLSDRLIDSPNQRLGDASAAAVVEPSDEGLRIDGWAEISSTFDPLWVLGGRRAVGSEDARYSAVQAGALLSKIRGTLAPKDNVKAVISTWDDRLSKGAARGAKTELAPGSPLSTTGFTGAAQPLLNLAGALPSIGDGPTILCGLGGGAAALKLTSAGKLECPTLEASLKRSRPIDHYRKFQEIRSFLSPGSRSEQIFSSQIMLHRDREFLLRLHGLRCRECRSIHSLPVAACQRCGADKFESILLGRTGKVFTFTHEYYIPTPEPPVTMAVVDLEGGGRILVQVADARPDEIRTGSAVRLSLRCLHMGGGYPNYYWKAIPV